MRVFNLRDTRTGKLIRKKHWGALGHLKAYITNTINRKWRHDFESGQFEVVVYDLVETQAIPILGNNEWNQAMYHTLKPEEKK